MNFNEYQKSAAKTAIYPPSKGFEYLATGLAAEAGEVAEKIKKHMRDGRSLVGVGLELGDVLWYISALADDLGITLEEIAQANVDKLASRMERGKLGGSGDE